MINADVWKEPQVAQMNVAIITKSGRLYPKDLGSELHLAEPWCYVGDLMIGYNNLLQSHNELQTKVAMLEKVLDAAFDIIRANFQ